MHRHHVVHVIKPAANARHQQHEQFTESKNDDYHQIDGQAAQHITHHQLVCVVRAGAQPLAMNGAHDVRTAVELLEDVLALPGDRPRREYHAEKATDGDEWGAEGGRAAVIPHRTTGRPGHREERHIRFVVGPVPCAEGAGQRQLTERRYEQQVPNARDDIECLNGERGRRTFFFGSKYFDRE